MKRILLHSENLAMALQEAVSVLRAGGLVVYPTETMYGIAADAYNLTAVTRLLAFKNRPAGKAISLLVTDADMADTVVARNSVAKQLYQTFLPGPVTVISQSLMVADPRLASEMGTLGIRVSSHPIAQALVKSFNGPLTATSANAAGAARPYSVDTVLRGLSSHQKELIDLVLDAGELPHNEPSSVIDTTQEVQEVVRIGALAGQLLQEQFTEHEEHTKEVARRFVDGIVRSHPDQPVVIALEGPMGAGKTHFAKGVAEALGVTVPVTSPTYTLIKEYAGKEYQFVHMDLWRLTEFDAEAMEMSRYLQPGTIVVIEWPLPALPYLRSLDGLIGHYVGIEQVEGAIRRLTFRDL